MKKKIIAVGITSVLSAALLVGNIEYASHAFALTKEVTEKAIEYKSAKDDESNVEKSESVFVTASAEGNETDTIVSVWLKNAGINGTLKDVSELTDIKNTKGDEKFTQDGNDVEWETGDKDIYYQGKTTKSLPVGMEITYKLDGEEISPDDLAGKSGKVEIKVSYKNYSSKKVKINGEEKEIYTPFVMATGMILPVDNFTNVKVDNGELLSEGDNDIVALYGMPGLKESLDLENIDFGEDSTIDIDKLNDRITDTCTITADVTDFSLGQTYTVATTKLFDDIDLDSIKDTDDLRDKLDDLQDATTDLVDGSKKIKNGLDKLDKNFAKYAKAIKTLQKSVKKLNNGSKDLNNATVKYTKSTDKLLKSVNAYVDGTKKFAGSTKKYATGTSKVVDAVGKLKTGSESLSSKYAKFDSSLDKYVDTISGQLSDENLGKLTAGSSALNSGLDTVNKYADSALSSVTEAGTEVANLKSVAEECALKAKTYKEKAQSATDPALQQEYAELATNYGTMAQTIADTLTNTKKYLTAAGTDATAIGIVTNGKSDGDYDKDGSLDLKAGMTTLDTSLKGVKKNAAELPKNSAALKAASKQIKSEGIDTISSSLKELYKSGTLLTSNNKELNSGADSLIKNGKTIKKYSKKLTATSSDFRDGSKELKNGTSKLVSGVNELADKTGDVTDGINKLAEGSVDLYDGAVKFKDEGVDKLVDTVNDLLDGASDLKEITQELGDAAEDYSSFSGKSETMDGSVKFIITTDEIKSDDE